MPEAHSESAVALHCSHDEINADECVVVSVSALDLTNAATYAGKTRLRMVILTLK